MPPSGQATGEGQLMSGLHEDVFAITSSIRYVAIAHGQQVQMRSRPDLLNASRSDSDLYEELLVNPTLLTLATQRGNIDCGGLRYLIVSYGHFHQLVIPGPAGHVSVAQRQSGRLPASDPGSDGASRPVSSLTADRRLRALTDMGPGFVLFWFWCRTMRHARRVGYGQSALEGAC
jgi:hypothetical protein